MYVAGTFNRRLCIFRLLALKRQPCAGIDDTRLSAACSDPLPDVSEGFLGMSAAPMGRGSHHKTQHSFGKRRKLQTARELSGPRVTGAPGRAGRREGMDVAGSSWVNYWGLVYGYMGAGGMPTVQRLVSLRLASSAASGAFVAEQFFPSSIELYDQEELLRRLGCFINVTEKRQAGCSALRRQSRCSV